MGEFDLTDLSHYSSVLIAFSTIVYTIGTFLLWTSTKKTTHIIQQQLDRQVKTDTSSSENDILNAHRDLYFAIISNKKLLRSFSAQTDQKQIDVVRNYIASAQINHLYRIFIYYKSNEVATDQWDGLEKDAIEMMSTSFLKERWSVVKNYHNAEFREFVDNLLNGE